MLTGLANMKASKKWIPWVLIVVGVCVVAAAFWPAADETKTVDNHQQIATTTGNKSPALNVSTTGSNSPVYQAAGNQTINNIVVPTVSTLAHEHGENNSAVSGVVGDTSMGAGNVATTAFKQASNAVTPSARDSVEVKDSPGAVVGVIQNSPGSIQHIEVNQALVKDTRPLKDRIRAYLEKVNPRIIELLDSGQPSVCVMINTANVPLLREFQKEAEFGAYIEADGPRGVTSGYNNTVAGCLNDTQDIGTLVGYRLVFKNKLVQ